MNRVDDAFQAMERTNFLPPGVKDIAALDAPIPIGFDQTNSQPTTVRMMLEWLGPKPGEKILDVGSGSGWTTALMAYLVGQNGKVYAVEKVPELVKFGSDNCKKAGLKNVHFYEAGEPLGLSQFAPYDRILVSAAAAEIPTELVEQLKKGGRLVIPVKNSIHVIDKTINGDYDTKEYPGFVFVPLV